MFEKLSNNLNLLMAKARLNSSELARLTGLPATTIKKIRNGDSPNPTLATLIPLAKYFSMTLSEFVGELVVDVESHIISSQASTGMVNIPLISWRNAGTWPETDSASYIVLPTSIIHSSDTFALKIDDEELGDFVKGTMLIVDPSVAEENRDFVIVQKENNLPTLRQIIYDEDIRYLKPLVAGFSVSQLTPKHKILGVVIFSYKNNKSIVRS